MADASAYHYSSHTRRNIPTEQTAGFMPDEERAGIAYTPPPASQWGPVLSWDRASDLNDRPTLASPLYKTEKIHPEAFLASLRSVDDGPLFGAFNNLPSDADYRWYEYDGNWSNRLIHGESVHTMASLLQKESMADKVQMIYMDPPYGIGFRSNFQTDTGNRTVANNQSALPADPTTVQTFRDAYENGIHSYLDNLYRNFIYARELLHESGTIFLQIGPENVNRVAVLLDEVFGPENRIAIISFRKRGSSSSTLVANVTDYLLMYCKNRESVFYQELYEDIGDADIASFMSSYGMIEMPDGDTRKATVEERRDPALIPPGHRLFQSVDLSSQGVSRTGLSDPYQWDGREIPCPPGRHWSVNIEGIDHLAKIGRLYISEAGRLGWRKYVNELAGRQINNVWADESSPNDPHYTIETSPSVIERCLRMSTRPGDLVMDLTCGGGTTALIAESLGRRWITTDTSRVAIAITRQRLLSGAYDWYHLQDSAEGAELERQLSDHSITPPPHYRRNRSVQ